MMRKNNVEPTVFRQVGFQQSLFDRMTEEADQAYRTFPAQVLYIVESYYRQNDKSVDGDN